MAGFTSKCSKGDILQIGSATVRVIKTGRKATINIFAPPDVKIEYVKATKTSRQPRNEIGTAANHSK